MIGTHYCSACGGLVKFINRKPYNEDGSEHWDVCKQRQFEVVKKKGQPYSEENEAGFIYKGKRWPTWIRGPRIVGSKYQPDACKCGLPPWEICEEECEHKLAA